jgi:hypothetical protein
MHPLSIQDLSLFALPAPCEWLKAFCICVCVSLILTACAASPELKAVLSEKETIKETDKIQNAKMAWIGRYLLELSARKQKVETLSQEPLPDTWSADDYFTLAAMTSDIAVSQLGSSVGSDLTNERKYYLKNIVKNSSHIFQKETIRRI